MVTNLWENKSARLATLESTALFLPCYMSHYATIPTAPFHYTLGQALDNDAYPLLLVIGFRNSAKSTYSTTAYPLKAIITGKYKFIVIINDTKEQVEITMDNLRSELENNELIREDFPHITVRKSWSRFTIVLANGVRIVGKSRGQNIRGIRHKQSRPDLIILDDPENLKQVQKKKNRDATETWFNAEVLSCRADTGAKVIVIGNLLHNDGFIARLKKHGVFHVLELPIIDRVTKLPLWLAKYPTPKSLKDKRKEVGLVAYMREFMLTPVVAEDQPVRAEDIHYYPVSLLTHTENGQLLYKTLDSGRGVDLAISEKETADFTAFVGGLKVSISSGDLKSDRPHILIQPHPFHKRVGFKDTIIPAVQIDKASIRGTRWYVEGVGYQKAAIQTLHDKGLSVKEMRPISDKRSRLETVSPFIKDGTVLFPSEGCEELITELLGFGAEEHDDLVDALVYLLMGLLPQKKGRGGVGRPDVISGTRA